MSAWYDKYKDVIRRSTLAHSYDQVLHISSYMANTRCVDLGIDDLLSNLNFAFGTSYQLPGRARLFVKKMLNLLGLPYALDTQSLRPLLDYCISENYDFGTAFAKLRSVWFGLATAEDTLHVRRKRDKAMRESVVVNGQIIDRRVPPRRVWDLCANRVVPHWVVVGHIWSISHAWVEAEDRHELWTPINGFRWPVPLPRGADLEQIRGELLGMGARYVWLDVLCLRQWWAWDDETLRLDEHKVDVPTIGHVYEDSETVVCYFGVLGLPLTGQHASIGNRSWFIRAWTLQETVRNWTMGAGAAGNPQLQVQAKLLYHQQISSLRNPERTSATVFHILSLMQPRKADKEVDKVAALAYLLESMTLPVYDRSQSPDSAWTILANTMNRGYCGGLFFFFPAPGEGDTKWRPSWNQAMDETVALPLDAMTLTDEVDREDDVDWFRGPYIEVANVQGLTTLGGRRQGELSIEGMDHTFRVTATHEYLIPEGIYALAGSSKGTHWVVGRQSGDSFEKVSVLQMLDVKGLELRKLATERRIRLA